MKSIFSLFALLMAYNFSVAQQELIFTVADETTNEPLPGVIVSDDKHQIITGIDGRVVWLTASDSIFVESLGYLKQAFASKNIQKGQLIRLEEDVRSLNQVVVTADRDASDLSKTPVAISTLDPKLIQHTAATSLDQLVNKAPGVFMVDLGNEQHSMSIRQPISYKGLYLYLEDGMPIRPTGVFNHNGLVEMNMAAIKKMEIIKGPASSIYGGEAIGGTINIITQRATATPTAKIALRADNLGYKRTDFRVANTVKKLGVSVSGYYADRSNGLMEHTDFNKIALTAAVDYHFNEKWNLKTTSTYAKYRGDMRGSLDSSAFYSSDYKSNQTFTERNFQLFRTQFDLTRQWKNGSTSVKAFFRENRMNQLPSYRVKDDYSWRTKTGDKNKAHGEKNSNHFNTYGLTVQHNQKLNYWNSKVRVGALVDFSPTDFVANYISVTKSDDGIYTDYVNHTDSMLTDYKVNLLNTAAYAQYEASPTKNIHFVIGGRLDQYIYDYKNNLGAESFSGAPDSKNMFTAFAPKLGFTYTGIKNTLVYANYGQGFVPPQVNELYRGVKVPSLKPASYENKEIGVRSAIWGGKLNVDLAVYHLAGKNEIISVQNADGSRDNRNAGKTLHQGIELQAIVPYKKSLNLRVGGTFAEHRFVDYVVEGKDYSGKKMNGAPQLILNNELTFTPQKLVKGLTASVEWQYISPYFMDANNTKTYKGFDVFNVRVSYKYKGFGIWGQVLNVSDKLYALNARVSPWGKDQFTRANPRTFSLGVSYTFE